MFTTDNSTIIVKSSFNINLVWFIVCIVIAGLTFIGLLIGIIRYRKMKTMLNAAVISLCAPLLVAGIAGALIIGIGRSATNKDIYIDLNQSISLNMNFDLKAYSDINGLEVTFQFEDRTYNTIKKITKKIGNVKKGEQYKIAIKLSEFGITDIFKIYAVSAEVTGGRIPYYA